MTRPRRDEWLVTTLPRDEWAEWLARLQPRTGAEQPWEPEDLAVAEGKDPTPGHVESARRELEELGPAAIEKTVP
ncbi:MAG TPA: hypothetical protein VGP31_07955 [Planosporangium sp.]|jgi:hypothetical protein|nr:hypothetical protein [Planosporangium sp.]